MSDRSGQDKQETTRKNSGIEKGKRKETPEKTGELQESESCPSKKRQEKIIYIIP